MESTQCVGVIAQPGTDAYGLVRPMSHVLDQQHYACEPNVYKTECIGRPRCSLWWPKYPDPLTFAGRVGGKIKRTNRFRARADPVKRDFVSPTRRVVSFFESELAIRSTTDE